MSDAIRQAAELKPQAVMDAMDAASKAKDGHDGRWSWSTLAKELSDHIVIVQPAPIAGEEELVERITGHLASGGLFNPEMAIHDRVRDLLIDCRHALEIRAERVKEAERQARPDELKQAHRLCENNLSRDAANMELFMTLEERIAELEAER